MIRKSLVYTILFGIKLIKHHILGYSMVFYFQPNPCQQKGNLRKCPTWAFLCPYWNRPHYVWLPISGRFLARKLVSPTGHKRCSQAEEYLAVETCFPVLPWIPIPARFCENPGNGMHLDVGPNIFLPTHWSFILAVPMIQFGPRRIVKTWVQMAFGALGYFESTRFSLKKWSVFIGELTNPDLELG